MRTYQGRRWRDPKKAIMALAVIHTRPSDNANLGAL